MKGLRKCILNTIPESWETVLRRNRVIEEFVNLVYDTLPNDCKGNRIINGRKGWLKGQMRVYFMFNNYPMIGCFNLIFRKRKNIDWNKIQREINEYENYLK